MSYRKRFSIEAILTVMYGHDLASEWQNVRELYVEIARLLAGLQGTSVRLYDRRMVERGMVNCRPTLARRLPWLAELTPPADSAPEAEWWDFRNKVAREYGAHVEVALIAQ